MDFVRALSIAVILVLVANITLFAMRLIDVVTFWVIIAGCGIIAFKVIPRISRKTGKAKKAITRKGAGREEVDKR